MDGSKNHEKNPENKVDDGISEKITLANIQDQLSTKLEYKKAILGAVLAVVSAATISFFSARSASSASRVVGGQYSVKLYEYTDEGKPKLDANGRPVGRNEAIIPIDFGGSFRKPPKVIVSINGIDAAGNRNVRVFAYAGNNATKDKSDFVVRTWGDSIVFTVEVSWIAFEDLEEEKK